MASDLVLWGAGTSRTIRPLWMLAELGIDYEHHPIGSRTGETLTHDFRQLNPRHKIPVLQHKSFVLTESAAIVQYLAETFADPRKLYVPDDATSRATLNEWCYFIISELDATSLYVMRRHDGLTHIYGKAPTAVAAAKTYFLHNLEAMAPAIADATPYLFGDRLSAADILLVTCLDWAAFVGIQLPAVVSQYRNRIAERPPYQTAMKTNLAGASAPSR